MTTMTLLMTTVQPCASQKVGGISVSGGRSSGILLVSRAKAEEGAARSKIRNPKPEVRKKSEARNPKGAKPKLRNSEREFGNLELRNSGMMGKKAAERRPPARRGRAVGLSKFVPGRRPALRWLLDTSWRLQMVSPSPFLIS
jgi:hypothetical protein